MAVIGARAYGATDITVAARNRRRLDVAGLLGAATINTSDRQLPAHTEADVLIECTGVPSVARRALEALVPGGRAILAGVSGDDLSVNLLDVHIKELTIHGVFRYVDTWPAAIALAASHNYNIDQLVSGYYSLRDTHQALAARDDNPASIKAIIRP
jgi:L-iditol 2-dehydrogenase